MTEEEKREALKQREEMMRQMMERMKKQYEELPLPIVSELESYEEVMLPADDGVKLRTEIWRPVEPHVAPTVVVRCCYPRQQEMLKIKAEAYVKRGFAFVVQWCRGTGGSEGAWVPNEYDRADGLSLMRYLEADERIESMGYWGDSYLAFTGWVMADAVPPKMKTMYLGVYGCDRHTSAYKDGLFRQDILTAWAHDNAGRVIEADYLESAAYRPQVEVDEAMWGGKLPWYRDWITNTDRDCEYWNHGFWKMLHDIPGKIQIPIYVKDGWYDHHLGSAIATYELLSPEARAHSVLKLGPWNHGYMPAVTHQPIDNLEDDSATSPAFWFDQILRKKEYGPESVETYMIGADRWDVAHSYPIPVKETKKIFLDATKAARETAAEGFGTNEKAAGGLTEGKGQTAETAQANGAPEQVALTGFTYDPLNPVHSCGAESLFQTSWTDGGSRPQPEVGYRDDVLSFLSAPIGDDLEMNGRINVKLFVSTDVEDTAFFAKLMEVFPDGTAVNIRGTITTLAYRNGATKRGKYTPGQIVEINLTMWDVAWRLKAGSRLRLDITSSDFPQYAVHGNVTGPWSLVRTEDTKIAHQTIYTGGEYPSVIELPVV